MHEHAGCFYACNATPAPHAECSRHQIASSVPVRHRPQCHVNNRIPPPPPPPPPPHLAPLRSFSSPARNRESGPLPAPLPIRKRETNAAAVRSGERPARCRRTHCTSKPYEMCRPKRPLHAAPHDVVVFIGARPGPRACLRRNVPPRGFRTARESAFSANRIRPLRHRKRPASGCMADSTAGPRIDCPTCRPSPPTARVPTIPESRIRAVRIGAVPYRPDCRYSGRANVPSRTPGRYLPASRGTYRGTVRIR